MDLSLDDVGEYNITDPEFIKKKNPSGSDTKLSHAYKNPTSPIRTAQVKPDITHMVVEIPLLF